MYYICIAKMPFTKNLSNCSQDDSTIKSKVVSGGRYRMIGVHKNIEGKYSTNQYD